MHTAIQYTTYNVEKDKININKAQRTTGRIIRIFKKKNNKRFIAKEIHSYKKSELVRHNYKETICINRKGKRNKYLFTIYIINLKTVKICAVCLCLSTAERAKSYKIINEM